MANNLHPYTRQAFAEWATSRSTHAVTLNADRELTERRIREIFGTFCHNADRLILRRRNVRNVPGDQRLFGIAYPENLGTNAHLHCAFDFAALVNLVGCQSASKRDPLSACKRGPPGGVALGLITGTDFALGLA